MARDFTQSSQQFIASLDAEIERLQQLRAQVAAALELPAQAREAKPLKKRKGMSAEARARIAAAQKARWAKQKIASNTAAKKAPAKAAPSKNSATKKAAPAKTTTT